MPKRNISLNGLRSFEAAARLLSFTAAGLELHVTQAAVSQQIRGLENQLGLQLFKREKRGLLLTAAGQELALSTRSALSAVYDTIDRITGSDAEGILSISTLGSFASRWLIPRLADFQNKHPEFDLHIHTSDENADLFGSKVDACIRFSAIDQPGLCTEQLMRDVACLVCSPALAQQLREDPSSIYDQTLIIDGNQPTNHLNKNLPELTAEKCLSDLNLDKEKIKQLVFSQSDIVVQSALAGQGIAITRLTLCADEIEAGRLEILFGYCRPLSHGYSLVYPQYRASDSRLVTFRNWLRNETTAFCNLMDQRTKQTAAQAVSSAVNSNRKAPGNS